MSAVAFSTAVRGLLPGDLRVFDGQAPVEGATVPVGPWVVLTVRLPLAAVRSLGRPATLREIRVRAVIGAGTADGARIVADAVDGALEGARPAVAGWSTTRLEQINERAPEEADTVVFQGTNRHPMVAVLEYVFTASPTS